MDTEEVLPTTEKKKTFNGLAQYHAKKKEEQSKQQQKEIAALVFKEDEDAENEFVIDPSKIYVFQTVIETKALRNQSLGSSCKIYDEETKRIREIRYVPVAKSIWVDEMDESLKDYPLPYLGFCRNVMAVNGADTNLMNFMLRHDSYDGNKHRLSREPALFTLLDKDAVERKESKRHKLVEDALTLLNNTDIEALKPISRVIFNITDTDDLAVMNRLKDLAKTNPRAILENVDNPKLKRMYTIQKAIDAGIIEIRPLSQDCVWQETKIRICELGNVKETAKTTEEIAVFTFTEEGEAFFDLLQQKQ